jgi:hypothetical protein
VSRVGNAGTADGEATLDMDAAGPAVRTMARYLGWEAIV